MPNQRVPPSLRSVCPFHILHSDRSLLISISVATSSRACSAARAFVTCSSQTRART